MRVGEGVNVGRGGGREEGLGVLDCKGGLLLGGEGEEVLWGGGLRLGLGLAGGDGAEALSPWVYMANAVKTEI